MTNIAHVAELVARLAHGNQKYVLPSGDQPYTFHLRMVVFILEHYGYPDTSLAAGWLHDTLEDTNLTYDDLRKVFGLYVADEVEACTGRGPNRKARNADIYRKLELKTSGRHIKLADRMANVHCAFAENNERMADMYLKEHTEFIRHFPSHVRIEQLRDYVCMMEDRAPLEWLKAV